MQSKGNRCFNVVVVMLNRRYKIMQILKSVVDVWMFVTQFSENDCTDRNKDRIKIYYTG